MRSAQTFTETSSSLSFTSETDRVYTPPSSKDEQNALVPLVVTEGGAQSFVVTREALPDVTVWNGWEDKIKAMEDAGVTVCPTPADLGEKIRGRLQ